MIAALRYFVAEAVTSMRRSRAISLLAIGTIGVALALLSSFLYLSANVRAAIASWERDVQVDVYLRDGIGEEERGAVLEAARRQPGVERAEYVSKEEALSRFRSAFADLADLPAALGFNPFPASLEVKLQDGHRTPAEVGRIAAALRKHPGVEEVLYDTGWVARLHALVNLASGAAFLLGGILVLAATFTTANVIRLALFSRRDEIEILQLVGATRGFIRGPFLVEGALAGIAGALAALAALAGAHLGIRAAAPGAPLVQMATARFLDLGASAGLVAGGGLLGLAGSFLAVRRFLR